MSLAEGLDASAACTLADLAERRSLTESELGALLYTLAAALRSLHQRGGAHGDVTASRVLLATDGKPSLSPPVLIPPTTATEQATDVDMLVCLGLELGRAGPLREILRRRLASADALGNALESYASSGFPDPTAAARRPELRGPTREWNDHCGEAATPVVAHPRRPTARRVAVALAVLSALLCFLPRRSAQQPPCDPAQVCAPGK